MWIALPTDLTFADSVVNVVCGFLYLCIGCFPVEYRYCFMLIGGSHYWSAGQYGNIKLRKRWLTVVIESQSPKVKNSSK